MRAAKFQDQHLNQMLYATSRTTVQALSCSLLLQLEQEKVDFFGHTSGQDKCRTLLLTQRPKARTASILPPFAKDGFERRFRNPHAD